jgi:hypothetical protein
MHPTGITLKNSYLHLIRKCNFFYLSSEYFFTTDPGVPGSIPGHYKKIVGLERGPLSLVSTTKMLLDRKVAAPV